MYPEFEGARAKEQKTLKDLANVLGITYNTLSQKLMGKSILTLKECEKLKEAVNSDLPIEILFKERG